jgi:iron-sulfur cluster repair protein YtfE (RIC family)
VTVDLVRAEHHHLFTAVQRLLDAADGLDDTVEILPNAVHEVHAFLVGELLPHVRAEEHALYPVVGELLGSPMATASMSRQHAEVERLVERLGRLRDDAIAEMDDATRRNLRQVLYGLHAILTLHLATEEELYLPLIESRLSPKRSGLLAESLVHAEAPPATAVVPR